MTRGVATRKTMEMMRVTTMETTKVATLETESAMTAGMTFTRQRYISALMRTTRMEVRIRVRTVRTVRMEVENG